MEGRYLVSGRNLLVHFTAATFAHDLLYSGSLDFGMGFTEHIGNFRLCVSLLAHLSRPFDHPLITLTVRFAALFASSTLFGLHRPEFCKFCWWYRRTDSII